MWARAVMVGIFCCRNVVDLSKRGLESEASNIFFAKPVLPSSFNGHLVPLLDVLFC
jgi:hypothetical protein